MFDISETLRRQYAVRTSGSDSSVSKLFQIHWEISKFFSDNYLICDEEYVRPLFSPFFEGIASSLLSSADLYGKLMYLTSNEISTIILYGNWDTMRDIFYRYKISKVDYEPYEDHGFVEMIRNLITYLLSQRWTVTGDFPRDTHQHQMILLLNNAIKMTSVVALTRELTKELCGVLIDYVSKAASSRRLKVGGDIVDFISNSRSLISIEDLQTFFELSFDRAVLINENATHVLYLILQERAGKIELTEVTRHAVHETIKKMFATGDFSDFHRLTYFLALDSSDHNVGFLTGIDVLLRERFIPEVFYHLAIYDLVSVNEEYLDKYTVATCLAAQSFTGAKPGTSGDRKLTDRQVDSYINLMFKLERKIPLYLSMSLAGKSSYYNWLFFIDSFDYSFFRMEWLTHMYTKSYVRYYRQSEGLKGYMLAELNERPNPDLAFAFVDIFERKL